MSVKLKYCLFSGLIFAWFMVQPVQAEPGKADLFLFTDRSWALSGDTVWFYVSGTRLSGSTGKVVHVQLESISCEPVSRVMVRSSGGSGTGYLVVPDSLDTGVFRLFAYTGKMRNEAEPVTAGRLLTVYHRFEEEAGALNQPDDQLLDEWEPADKIQLKVSAGMVQPGEEISVALSIPPEMGNQIREMVVSASLEGTEFRSCGYYRNLLSPKAPTGAGIIPEEEDGFFVEGKVLNPAGGTIPPRSMVMLSIPDSIPYFDYYFTGDDGYFRFKLENTYGTAEIFIRAIAGEGEELAVEVIRGMLASAGNSPLTSTEPDEKDKKFISDMLQADWFDRIYSGDKPVSVPFFEMKPRMEYAFYGVPDRRVVPEEYIELPDFREITRELLPAVRFRKRGDHFKIQVMDNQERIYFDKSPLRLVNGIPFFDDDHIYRFKSTDIRYIDVIYRERIFGDISFKGVLAISLSDGFANWLGSQKYLGRFLIPCLQLPLMPSYNEPGPEAAPSSPDFRRHYLFSRAEPLLVSQTFSFRVSDLKGAVAVRIQGVSHDNQPFEITKHILVQ